MRTVKLLIILAVLLSSSQLANAQALKVAAGNTLIGTANGAVIGLSVMGLSNSTDFTPIRFGIGAGTLYGLGVGAYDVSKMDGLGFYYVEGLFNSTEYTSLIVLLDTFYGGVTGSVLGLGIALMANENVGRYIQYGASMGSMAGFAFGLVDAFYFSNSSGSFSYNLQYEDYQHVDGMIVLGNNNLSLGLVQPTLYETKNFSTGYATRDLKAGLQLAHLKLFF